MTDPRAAAVLLFRKRPHWSLLAEALITVEAQPDLILASPPAFPSAMAWATEELGLSRSEYVSLSKLADGMRAYPEVAWHRVPRSRAGKLLSIFAAGGEPAWESKACYCTPVEWEAACRAAEGKPEAWITLTLRLPGSTRDLLVTTLEAEAETCGIPAGRALSREHAHALLERIVVRAGQAVLAEGRP